MAEIFQSNFVFGLQGNKYLEFISKIARPEIEKIIETDDYEIIGFENHLSFQDFKETDNIVSHIYTAFLKDIQKENSKVSFKKKVCITLDKRLCKDTCSNTGRKITTIKLAGVDLAYFIYFDVKEFFDFVYGDTVQEFIEHQNQEIKNNEQDLRISELPVTEITRSTNQSTSNESKEFKNGLIEKYGFIHNIGYDRNGFEMVFVWTEIENGIPLYYEYYPNLDDFIEGDLLKMYFEGSKRYPKYVEMADNQDEIRGFVKRFRGVLAVCENYAFVNTEDDTAIFVKPKLTQQVNQFDGQLVECLATLSVDKKWRAETIYSLDKMDRS